jgi:predicted DNA-binding transcriptional regulator AlpA
MVECDYESMTDSGELWTASDIASWLGISKPAVYALVAEKNFPLPIRGLSHSRRWSQTVVKEWIRTPRFMERDSNLSLANLPIRVHVDSARITPTIVERPLRTARKRTL